MSYEWPPGCGGGGRVAATLADGLRARGHDVLTDGGDGALSYPLRSYRRLRDRITSLAPDVIHGHFSVPTCLLLPRLAARVEAPLVVTVMGSDIHNPRRFRRLRPLLDRVNECILSAADLVVAPSRDLQQRVAARGVACERIPHGIPADGSRWRRQGVHDPLRVLTVARLAPGKNVDVAIDAVRELREHRDADLRVCGDGSQRETVERAAATSDWLDWRGWVEETAPHYEWADIFLLPSAWEAFGLVYLEALRAGVPVVATPNGGAEDIVRDGVGALAPADADAQAEALRRVADAYAAHQRATKGYVAEAFSADRMTRQYHNRYLKLA